MLQLILFQVVTAAVIIGALYLFFGSQVKIALSRLQVLHQESMEKEEVINRELERAKIQAQSEISRSQEEAKNILDSARANAEKTILESEERGQLEAKKILAEAEEKIKHMEKEVLASVDAKAVALAQDLIKYTFSQKGYAALQAQLIDDLIEDFKAMDNSRLGPNVDQAEVDTPVALSPVEKQRLAEVLSAKMGHPVALDEKIDDSLISGLVIKLGGLVVDGSLKNKLMRVTAALRLKK